MKDQRRPKTFEEKYKELIGDFEKLDLTLKQFEITNDDHWVQSFAGTLHKLIVRRRRNTPLFLELASVKNFPLTVYVSNIAIATIESEKKGTIPKPTGSFVPNILSPNPVPLFTYPISLEKALDIRCLIIGGTEFTFKDILINIRDTESHHSDPDKPEALDKLAKLEILGYSSAYMASYHLGQVVSVLGKNFSKFVNKS